MKWLLDTNISLLTPKAVNPKIFLKGEGRGKRTANGLTPSLLKDQLALHPLTPKRVAGRWPGFKVGHESPLGSLAALASPAAPSRPQMRPKAAAAGVGAEF